MGSSLLQAQSVALEHSIAAIPALEPPSLSRDLAAPALMEPENAPSHPAAMNSIPQSPYANPLCASLFLNNLPAPTAAEPISLSLAVEVHSCPDCPALTTVSATSSPTGTDCPSVTPLHKQPHVDRLPEYYPRVGTTACCCH
nr:hypothetical protein [Providencia rettgeri]